MIRRRVALITVVLSGLLLVPAAPASATCHPEKPSTCEIEWPPLEPSCTAHLTLPTGHSFTIDYCNPEDYLPE